MRAKQVLLYSGGMDSLITAHAFPEAKLVYFDTGASYSKKELQFLHQIAPRPVEVDRRLSLSGEERQNFIVPMRNLFLACLGALHGDEVLLAATAGDPSLDKDEVFAEMTSILLGRICADPNLPDFGEVCLKLPYKSMSKAQMTADYLASGGSPEKLAHSISCYHPDIPHCGQCETCFRKWVALRLSGIENLVPWELDPYSYNWHSIAARIEGGQGWHGVQEDKDTMVALGLN